MARACRRSARLVDLGVKSGIVEKSGAWFSYNSSAGQGRENSKQFLRDNPAVAAEIESAIRRTQADCEQLLQNGGPDPNDDAE